VVRKRYARGRATGKRVVLVVDDDLSILLASPHR
jgi:hypothetical protein